MRETSVPFNTPKLVLTKGLKKKKITKSSKPIHPTQAIHSHQPNQSMRHEKKKLFGYNVLHILAEKNGLPSVTLVFHHVNTENSALKCEPPCLPYTSLDNIIL